MKRDIGSAFVLRLRAEILRFAQDDGAFYIRSITRPFVNSTLRFPIFSTLRRIAARGIQHIPYKTLEERRLRAGVPEKAFFAQTPIKMSVLAGAGGSSFHR